MNHKTAGLVSLVAGIGLIALNWYMATHEGRYYVAVAILGPTLVVFGLCSAILPQDMLFQKQELERDGEKIVSYDRSKLTPLGIVIVVVGVGLGGLHWLGLHQGWFL
jgi:hypothetical protein